jgi:hypothetical protein
MLRRALAALLACAAAYTTPDRTDFALSERATVADFGHSNGSIALIQTAVSAAASSTAATTCDPSWCNCKDHSCTTHDEEEGCDLCSQKYVFVLAAGGRTGSTSLLEGLNALPGVSLSGENFGVLEDLRAEFAKVSELVGRNGRQSPAAYFVPKPDGVLKHTLCGQQSMVARWAGRTSELAHKADQIYGFKELLQVPSMDSGGEFEAEQPHLPSRHREWVEFLETLFPCSRIVLNLRRDRPAHARAVLTSFFDTTDRLDESVPPLDLVEKELEAVSQFMLEWHHNRSATGRSFLMYTEDMDAQRFTELAQWLGQPCTFNSAPNANEYDPKDAMPYFHHSKAVDVACTSDPPPQLAKAPEPPPEPPLKGQHTSAYERLAHELDEKCSARVELPPNAACVPSELLKARVEKTQPGLIAVDTGEP